MASDLQNGLRLKSSGLKDLPAAFTGLHVQPDAASNGRHHYHRNSVFLKFFFNLCKKWYCFLMNLYYRVIFKLPVLLDSNFFLLLS
jgi:hypothetical protein